MTADPVDLLQALAVLRTQTPYLEHLRETGGQDWQYERIFLPHQAGRLLLAPPGIWWATALRLEAAAPDHLTLEDWTRTTGDLWIGDVVGVPGTSGVRIGRWLQEELVVRGIAKPDELVYFHRVHTARPGWFRTKRADQ